MSLSQENAGVGGGGVTSNTSNEQTSIILQSLPTLSSSYPPQETPDKPLQDELEPSAKPDVSEDKRGEPTKPAGDSDKLQTMAELEHEPGPIRLVDDEHDDQVTLNSKHKLPRRVAFWWMFALYLVMFLAGWNDSTTGPLLLRMQSHYSVSYAIISLVFICGFIGFSVAAGVNIWMTDKFGFGATIVFAASCQIAAYSILSASPPFPLFLIAYVPNGLGMGLQDALVNSIITRLPGATHKMALAHAMYGFGALVAPLIATQFARSNVKMWNYHYLVSLGIALADVAGLISVFKFKREETLFQEQGYVPLVGPSNHDDVDDPSQVEPSHGTVAVPEAEPNSSQKLLTILKMPFVQCMAIFSWIYVGIEVTIGGWAVAYIVEVRGGGDDSGYVSSGFFGGLMVGRIVHLAVVRYLSEQKAVWVYTAIALGLQIVVWQVNSIIVNAVAFSIIGLALGPIYPIMMNATAAVLEPKLAGGAIAYIAAFGQCGSALFPWVTGALASKFGVWSLQPMLVALIIFEGALWSVVVFMSRHKWSSNAPKI